MAKIEKTLIATTDPVTIGGGIPLFPDVGTSQLGFSIGATLWDTSKTIDIPIFPTIKLSTRSSITLEGGILGPCWGGRMAVEGEVADGDMALTVSLDEFTAGMVIGVYARFEIQLEAQEKAHRVVFDYWDSHIETYWKEECNVVAPIELDVLPTLFNLALTIGGLIPALSKIIAFIPKGLLDHMRDTRTGIVDSGGTITPEPSIIGQIDLVNLIKAIGFTTVETVQPELAPAVEAVSKVDKIMGKLKPNIATGPVFGISFPVEISISGLCAYADDDRYFFDEPTFSGVEITAENTRGKAPDADRVGVTFSHRTGVDLVIGWFDAFSLLKVFSKEIKWTKDVFSTLGIDVASDSTAYNYEINNGVGKQTDTTVEVVFLDQE